MNNLITKNTHLQWYLKIKITEDISLRYYFVFEDRPEYNKKWFIKSHSKKEWGEISEEAVKLLLEAYNLNLNDAEEIIARSISNTKYRRLELENDKEFMPLNINTFLEHNNNIISSKVLKADLLK